MTTRCKFRCNKISESEFSVWDDTLQKSVTRPVYTAEMWPVTNGSEENRKFFAATPCGRFEVGIHAEKVFEVGKEYYIDITPAEPQATTALRQ